jgi:ParB family transcriptional regulator, chromosome partitioning protein
MQADDQSNAEGAEVTPPLPEGEAHDERPRKHHVAPALIALDRIDDDETFKLRPEGDFAALATDLARLGQLFPIDLKLKPPDRFQVICGFRRVAALRFLQREKVLARLHTDLTEEDALLLALAEAIHQAPVAREELESAREKLQLDGRLTPTARDMIDKALSGGDELAPETVEEESAEEGDQSGEEEVDADELASDVTLRLGEINQDLALLADVFSSLDEERRAELIKQLKYSAELVRFLEGGEE